MMTLAVAAAVISEWLPYHPAYQPVYEPSLTHASFAAGLLAWLIGGVGLVELLAWRNMTDPEKRGGVYGCVFMASVALVMLFSSTALAQYTAWLLVAWFLYGLTQRDRPLINPGFESIAQSTASSACGACDSSH